MRMTWKESAWSDVLVLACIVWFLGLAAFDGVLRATRLGPGFSSTPWSALEWAGAFDALNWAVWFFVPLMTVALAFLWIHHSGKELKHPRIFFIVLGIVSSPLAVLGSFYFIDF